MKGARWPSAVCWRSILWAMYWHNQYVDENIKTREERGSCCCFFFFDRLVSDATGISPQNYLTPILYFLHNITLLHILHDTLWISISELLFLDLTINVSLFFAFHLFLLFFSASTQNCFRPVYSQNFTSSMRGTGGLSLQIWYFWWEASYLNFTCLWNISSLVWIESINIQSLYQRNFHFKSFETSKGQVQFILFLVYNFGKWLPFPYT